MSDYTFDKTDGKIHTRYSELKRATPGGIRKLMEERLGGRTPFSNDTLKFGELRHEMWRDESLRTGKLPECFGVDWPVTYIETEFATELFPGIIIHSRPDVIAFAPEGYVVDYKTMTYKPGLPLHKHAYTAYRNDQQCPFYAMQLRIHGEKIAYCAYFVEIWNQDRSTVIAYDRLIQPVTLADYHRSQQWAKERCETLIWGHEELGPEIQKKLDTENTSAL